MSDMSATINPLKFAQSEYDCVTDHKINDIQQNFKKMNMYLKNFIVAVLFLVCSNFYLLYSASHLVNKQETIEYPNPVNSGSLTLSEPEQEYVYDTLPDLSTSQSKHVVNLIDYGDMNSDYKDNIFNNLDSIIVQEGDLGTARHQITKVNWLFDEADTMLLYTALGEVFALAANGTISAYDTVNGARRLLQSQVGWLEGKISDVIHHGSSYKEMREKGKAYLKTRENKQEEDKIMRQMSELNNELEQLEIEGNDITEQRNKIEELQDMKEQILNERQKIPIMEQKPITEKSLDDFLYNEEIQRIEKEFNEEKLQEINEYRERKIVEIQQVKQEKQDEIMKISTERNETIKQLVEENKDEIIKISIERNETIKQLVEEKEIVIDQFENVMNITKINKKDEFDAIKYDLDSTKYEIEQVREEMIKLLQNENNITKRQYLIDIEQKLIDTTGKISFTQMIIDENKISEYDKRPIDKRLIYDREILKNDNVKDIINEIKNKESDQIRNNEESDQIGHYEELETYEESDQIGHNEESDQIGHNEESDQIGHNEELETYEESDQIGHYEESEDYIHNDMTESVGGDIWDSAEEEDILKNCSIINDKHVCVCTNKISRDVYRC